MIKGDNHISKISQLDYGINLDDRIIYFTDEVDVASAEDVDNRIRIILQLSDDKTSPITLKISSYGGDAYALFGILDIMELAPVRINTQGVGPLMSAGAFLLVLNGTGVRSLTRRSTVMLHEIRTFFVNEELTATELEHRREQDSALQNLLLQELATYSNKSVKYWQEKLTKDYYLTPEECLNLKLIDKIERKDATPKKSGTVESAGTKKTAKKKTS